MRRVLFLSLMAALTWPVAAASAATPTLTAVSPGLDVDFPAIGLAAPIVRASLTTAGMKGTGWPAEERRLAGHCNVNSSNEKAKS